jgi:hypothetical protein
MMFESMFNIHTPQIVVIIAVDDEPNPQVFKLKRNEHINKVLELLLG